MAYQLLPFRFERFNDHEYLLTNEVGEYIFLQNEDFYHFVKGDMDEHCDENRDKEHYENKARSATGVETGASLRVFNGKLKSLLVAEHALMLSAVVLEGTADVLHKGNSRDVADEDRDLQNALDCASQRPVHLTAHKVLDSLSSIRGDEEEKTNAESNAKDCCKCHNNRHELVAKLLGEPFFEFCFVFHFVNAQHFHAVIKSAVAKLQHFDHIDASAKKGNICPFMFFTDGNEFTVFDFYASVVFSDCKSNIIAAAHHNAFKHCLSANFTKAAVLFFLCQNSNLLSYLYVSS